MKSYAYFINYHTLFATSIYIHHLNAIDYVDKLMLFFKLAGETPQMDTHWFSESGIIDVFVMLGPSPRSVFRQYSRLTGPTMLPPVSYSIFISFMY